jgi:hypothetical protein
MSPTTTRRSSTRLRGKQNATTAVDENPTKPEDGNDTKQENGHDDRPVVYPFDGVDYTSYQDVVQAKRQRNQQILQESDLLTAVREAKEAVSRKSNPRGLQKRKPTVKSVEDPTKRRKSNRLQGIQSNGLSFDDKRIIAATLSVLPRRPLPLLDDSRRMLPLLRAAAVVDFRTRCQGVE